MVLQGVQSIWKEVTSSVIHGSVFGQICFTVYMDDLETDILSFTSKFADDTKIAHTIRRQKLLQGDMSKLVKWTEKWQMKSNTNKCAVLHLSCIIIHSVIIIWMICY